MDLTDKQWDFIKDLLPPEQLVHGGRPGRPWRDPRDVLNGILWVMRTGAPWADMPARYPPSSTCHRRFQQWIADGTLKKVLRRIAEHLRDHGKIDLTEGFIDGSHAGAKKGDLRGAYSAWEGYQDHGGRGRSWSSARDWDCEWSAK